MNPWLTHVANYRKSHPNMSYSEALKNAKSSYTKVSKMGRGQSGLGHKMRGKQMGRGAFDEILQDIKDAKLGSKASDYITNKIKQSGYGK